MNTIIHTGKHNRTYDVEAHSHSRIEVIYCTSGSCVIKFNDKQVHYQKGDIIVIQKGLIHENCSSVGFTNIHLQIDSININFSDVIKISDLSNRVFYKTISMIYYFYNSDIDNKELLMKNYGELISNLIITYSENKKHSDIIDKLKNSIVKNFSDPDFDLAELFDKQNDYNASYLKKLFKKEVSFSPNQYLINLRINYAQKLLLDKTNNMSISYIAYQSGYLDPLYFSRVFKTVTGVSPKAFRE